ncbi:transglycosylase SLT domain-containing protein [Streptomyces sp. NPDC052179]|uniref:transglycosylase SLT domain-containing protein n=1 Tax=Streptomyces sp. NPDC052179 TaxID=3155680 RepID=UPI00341A9AAC
MPEAGSIKVGNAWIKITPELDHSQLKAQLDRAEKEIAAFSGKTETLARQTANLRAKLEEYVTARYGEEAAKRVKLEQAAAAKRSEYSKTETAALMKAFATVTEASSKAERAQTVARETAARQRERIALNARNLEVRYGTEVAASYRKDVAAMMKNNKGLSIVRINEAKQWSAAEILEQRKIAAENLKQTRIRETQVKTLSALVIRQAQLEATEAVKAARTAQAAYTSAYTTRHAQILSTMNSLKAASIAAAQGQIAAAQAAKRASQQTITANNGTVKALQANAQKAEKSWGRSTYNMGRQINSFGSSVTELGRNINSNLVTPLAAAGAAMSALGISAADSIVQAQTALKGIGISNKDTSNFIETLKEFGVQTPYTVEDMFKYGSQYARSNTSHGMNSQKASTRATDLVQAVGDLAAYGGNTDPALVERTLRAVGNIMESDRASLRNVRTIAESGGLDIQSLAQMLGFKDRQMTEAEIADRQKQMDKMKVSWEPGKTSKASGQMMLWMAKAAETGGVPGLAVTDALIERAGDIGSGEPGSPARQMGAATVKGRLSNMYEATKFGLSDMFVSEDQKSGLYKYTGAGAALMGNASPVYEQKKNGDYKLDKDGNRIVKGYQYEGGLLETLGGLGADLKEPSGKVIAGLFESLTTLAGWAESAVKVLTDHPGITDAVVEIGKWAALVGVGALALGLLIKTFGLLTKALSPVAMLAKGLFKTVKGTVKIGNQVVRGALGSDGDSYRDRYRNARTASNGGDNRSLGRRAVDSVRGRNSQVAEIKVDTDKAKQKINELDAEIEGLRTKIRNFKGENFNELADHLAGSDSSVKAAAERAAKAVREADTATTNLKGLKLQALEGEFNKVTENTNSLKSQVSRAASKVSDLNSKGLGDLDGELTGAKGKSKSLDSALSAAAKQAGNLNGKSLGQLKGQVDHVKDAAEAASAKVGGGKSSLASRVGQLNEMSTSSVVRQIKKLKDALGDSADKAKTLNSRLNDIANHAPGGGGSSSGKKTKKALGGVLPGYTPGRDVHVFSSPTAGELHLSGGEAVMRPEFTAAVGADEVNRINSAARTGGVGGVRAAMKFAKGGVLQRLGLGGIDDAMRTFNMGPDILGATGAASLYNSSDALGGPTRQGIQGGGKGGTRFIGSDVGSKFRGQYDFLTRDVFDLLKKAKIPSGWSQAVGIVGGALSPVSAEYFWDDVWKGQGNALERGQTYLSHMFSPKTLQKIVSNLFGGGWDSLKGLWETGKKLVTDPIGMIKDSINGVWEVSRNSYNGFVENVAGLREIWQNPMGHGSQVAGEIYETAKENLPNLDKLFDFSGKGLSSSPPELDGLLGDATVSPGAGDSVSRWTPLVKMVLAQLGLPQSDLGLVLHRIKVESGGNPKAINTWDINAKNGVPSQGLMQTIPPTFAAYAGPYKSRGITDPLASIYAGLNYATSRYGANWRKALSGTQGYATGTDGAARGWAWVGEEGPELVNFSGGETVLTHGDSVLAASNVQRGYASGTTSTRTTGLAADAKKGISTLNTAVSKLYSIITKAFSSDRIGSGTANSLNKWLDKQNKSLQKLVTERATIATKLKAANTKLTDVKAQESEMATSIADNAKQERSLTGLFNSEGVSFSSALSGLKERLKAIQSFKSNIARLSEAGYSEEIIAEISDAGIEQGSAMAKELLTASKSQVSQFNSAYSTIGTEATALGKSAAKTYYATGKQAAQALVDGLTAEDKKLTKGIEKLAASIQKKFKKSIKIGSNSPVDSSLAALLTWFTGQGQAVKGGGSTSKKKTTRTTTTYSTDSKGQKVTTVTTTTTDPAKGSTTTVTKRTVGGKTTSSTKVSKIKGYATGTRSASRGVALVGERGPELINFKGGERVYNDKETASVMGPRYEIHIHEAKAENTTQSVLRALKYAETMAAL